MVEFDIVSFWDIAFAALGDRNLITGSPNRSERRFIFHDTAGCSYIAEGCSPGKKTFQIRQNTLLEFFVANHLPAIHPFYRTRSGEHGVMFNDLFWQIRPYIPAENIPRATLGEHANYGILWGDFLLQMKKVIDKSPDLPAMHNPPFYMANQLPKLLKFAEAKMPSITGHIREFERLLAPFFKWERKAESMFAHGDFHPGNILMGQGMIRVVIDWEFAGAKFPGYDMALLIGCLAMDHPDNLFSPAVCALRNTLYANRYLPDDTWERLPQMIAATRLGWLGEWLTLEDKALVAQELELISILLDGDFAKESTLKG